MSRNRKSAKQAGQLFESHVAGYLADALDDDRIERRAKNGNKDRGDIGGVRTMSGQRVVVECKNTAKLALGVWITEAETERGNDDAAVGVVVHKRVGKGAKQMGEQYVTMTLEAFALLLGGEKPHQFRPDAVQRVADRINQKENQ